MTIDWPRTALSTLLRQVSRPEDVDASREYTMLGTRWYAGGLFKKDVQAGQSIKALRIYRVQAGDFVYNRLFAWKGSFAVADEEANGCYVSNEFPCFEVDSLRLDARYLLHYFTQVKSWNKALGLSSGATPTSRNRLKEKQFLEMSIPLPPMSEQRHLVDWIEGIAGKIEKARRYRGEAAEEVGAYVVSLHQKLAGTRTKALGEILVLDEDAVPITPDGAYPQVGVRSFGAGLFKKGPVVGSETTYRAFNRLYGGAIVLSQVKAWEGAIAVAPADLQGWYVSPEYRTFRCRPTQALPDYLVALLPTEWFWSRLGAATRGVGARRERTRPEQFLELRIPMPEVADQEFAARTFERLGPLRTLQSQVVNELEAIAPAMLDRAFRGEM